MKNLFLYLSFIILILGCNQKIELTPVPVAPILKEIVMPEESVTLPGSNVSISGKGFDTNDIISCRSLDGEDDYAVTISIPVTASGRYEVSVTRANLTTVLPGMLTVAKVIPVSGIVMPSGNVNSGDDVIVSGSGFEAGDEVVFTSDVYPDAVDLRTTVSILENGMSFTVPSGCYGVNTVTLTRGDRQANLGVLNVSVSIGDEIGGGIVYYVSDGGIHGLIAKKSNVGTGTDQWGPTNQHGDTSAEIYTGKENTRICVEAMAGFHQQFATWPSSKKSAAELCDETIESFLPSRN